MTGLHFLIAATPLAALWFATVSALPPDLVSLARTGFWLALPLTTLAAFQSFYQGALMTGRKTRAITESMLVFLAMVVLILGMGISTQRFTGLYVAFVAFALSTLAQVIWLYVRSKPVLRSVRLRDARLGTARIYPATTD
jgi:Na+-driven multidrug efflux pump